MRDCSVQMGLETMKWLHNCKIGTFRDVVCTVHVAMSYKLY